MISGKGRLKAFVSKEAEAIDLGFGSKTGDSGRLINRDGSFNIKRQGLSFKESFSPYHWLIGLSWKQFLSVVLVFYFLLNCFFATIYYLLGVDAHLVGAVASTNLDRYLEAFFFSGQTLTTVGYGRISPIGIFSSLVASFEALCGLLSFALVTGILYGRFAKPSAKVLFSSNAIIAPYKDINALMFRIANGRSNQLIEVEVQLTFSYIDKEQRRYNILQLERQRINFFPTTWTIVHPIDETSPMYGLSIDNLREKKAEFLIIIKAFDDSFSQTVYARGSYKYDELVSGVKFDSKLMQNTNNGITILELDKLSNYNPAPLN